jgi:hypothetical protein
VSEGGHDGFFFKRGKKEGRRETMEKTNCGGVDLSQLALLPSCLFSTSTPDQLPLSLFLSLPLSLALSLSLSLDSFRVSVLLVSSIKFCSAGG